ncbi:MAG: prolipoprotein diacylglyceryl transferase, partial [Oscillospiraceae bacterium]|nr:prolipoprotein diacylglyceryl transferase [Oscillospiraceae bacterium]
MGATVSFPVLGIELTLRRVAFSLFGIEVYWYGLLIALGTVLAVLYAFKKLDEFGLDQDRVIDVILVGTICAVVGSRLYYIIFSAPGEFNSLREALDIRRGGVAFYGSVIGAFASAVISCRIKQLKLRPVADLAAIGFLIGQCVGRWGNFINQEAFGGNTSLPWGMTSQHISQYLRLNQLSLEARGMQIDPLMPVHPTFLYESLWCLLGLILLTLYIKRRMYDGEIFLMYLAWNGAGRSVIEGLRTDSLYLGTIRISQLLAFVGFITAVLAIMVIRKNVSDKRKEDPEFAIPYGHTEQYQIDKAELAEQREKNITDKKAGKKAGAEPEEDDAEDDDEWDDDEEDSDEESADEEESDE